MDEFLERDDHGFLIAQDALGDAPHRLALVPQK